MAEAVTPPDRLFKPEPRYDRVARELLSGDTFSISRIGPNGATVTDYATALDLTHVPEDATDDELTLWATRVLELSEAEAPHLLENGRTPESKVLFEKIDTAYHAALKHLRDFLYFEYDPKKTFGVERIRTLNNIHTIMRGSHTFLSKKATAALKETSRKFCDVLIQTVAAFEMQKAGIKNLVDESNYVLDALHRGDEASGRPPLFVSVLGSKTHDHLMILDAFAMAHNPARHGQGAVPVTLSARGKSHDRMHSKIVRDPQLRESEAHKDAMGLRLIVDQEQGISTVLQILGRLFAPPFNADAANIRDDGFFGLAEEGSPQRIIAEHFGRNVRFVSEPQKSSSGGFTSLRIFAMVQVPEGGNGTPVSRPLEVQFIPVKASNETGARDHAVYELVQKVAEVSRTHKYVPIPQFRRYMKDVLDSFAARGRPISEKDLITWLHGRIAFVFGKGRDVLHIAHAGDTKRISNFAGLANQEWVDAVLHSAGRDVSAVLARTLKKLHA